MSTQTKVIKNPIYYMYNVAKTKRSSAVCIFGRVTSRRWSQLTSSTYYCTGFRVCVKKLK
jgi:hypothetical protein